jgi:hypothetical protein
MVVRIQYTKTFLTVKLPTIILNVTNASNLVLVKAKGRSMEPIIKKIVLVLRLNLI